MAEHRRNDREDEYRARRRQMIISPERYDPFADGKLTVYLVLILLLKSICDIKQCQPCFELNSFMIIVQLVQRINFIISLGVALHNMFNILTRHW